MSSPKDEYVFRPFMVTEVKCRGFDCPRPRSGHRIACDDTNIFCFGGYNPFLPLASVQRANPTWSPNCPLFKELWSFSLTTRKWRHHRVTENMPEELASNAMCVHGRYLMIFGGTGEPFGHKCSNDVIVWQTHSKFSNTKLNVLEVSGTKPPGLYGQSILCHDGVLYTVGGTNGFAYNCDIYRLDLRTLVWQPLFVATGDDTDPPGRYRHEVARVDNKLYIIGGGTVDTAFELMNIPTFDLDTNKWTVLNANLDLDSQTAGPRPRKCHSAVQIDTPSGVQVFVAGGSNGTSVFDDIWRLSIPEMQWTLMRKSVLPNPLYFHSSTVTSSGCMYIFGGIEPKNEATSRNNILYKVWLCVPKLSEICFEALMHFHPNLDQIEPRTLMDIGMPRHFVQRMHTD